MPRSGIKKTVISTENYYFGQIYYLHKILIHAKNFISTKNHHFYQENISIENHHFFVKKNISIENHHFFLLRKIFPLKITIFLSRKIFPLKITIFVKKNISIENYYFWPKLLFLQNPPSCQKLVLVLSCYQYHYYNGSSVFSL